MRARWIPRRSHPRRLKSGGTTSVRETWELRFDRSGRRAQSYRHSCPQCGAVIISVHMKRGGWAHFEGMKGLGRVKHPCLHRGEGLSRRRDEETPDLFDKLTPPNGAKP
jgi:ribosomal protein S27AE